MCRLVVVIILPMDVIQKGFCEVYIWTSLDSFCGVSCQIDIFMLINCSVSQYSPHLLLFGQYFFHSELM